MAGDAAGGGAGGGRARPGRRPSGVLCVLCALGTLLWLSAMGRLVWGAGGALEASVVAGGWGLSLLPVHVAPDRGAAPRAADLLKVLGLTTAWRSRRWGAGSDQS
ncbi:hypothetical protein [Streptomyces sp. NPDC048172]|uniref:hypothetical protein n=1 Tax=Streptomyces sp. NPDC048172 TaxID=3365505 RepID=UPI00371520CE